MKKDLKQYRYGFNGKENDNEVKGEGNQQDYGMRIYDPRLGRFLSVDPMSKEYPMLTSYQFASNSPIQGIDLDGLELLPINSSMFRVKVRSSISASSPSTAPFFWASAPLITEQTVTLVNENISYVFKDAFGRPKFTPRDAGIDINNVKPAFSTQSPASVSTPDGRPPAPPWPWSMDDQSDGLEPSKETESSRLKQQTQHLSNGRKWYYWESETAQVSSPIISVSSGFNEVAKYISLWTENTPIWNAYTKVDGDGRALHTAATITKEAFVTNKGNSYFRGERNKADFTNYLLDGTLPSSLTFSGGKLIGNFSENLNRRLNIQFYGIIYLKRIDKLDKKTLKIYQSDIKAWETLNPGKKHNYNDAINNNY